MRPRRELWITTLYAIAMSLVATLLVWAVFSWSVWAAGMALVALILLVIGLFDSKPAPTLCTVCRDLLPDEADFEREFPLLITYDGEDES
jgi:hypothetical protein